MVEREKRAELGRGKARLEEVVVFLREFSDFYTVRLLRCGFHVLLCGSVLFSVSLMLTLSWSTWLKFIFLVLCFRDSASIGSRENTAY